MAALIAEIELAFADVGPEGRETLRQAYRADYYGDDPDVEVGAEWDDRDKRWQDIPDDVLDFFSNATSVFVFGNDKSFHYYLPAYMAWDLKTGGDRASNALRHASEARFALLNHAQRDVVRGYLRHLLDFYGPDKYIEKALRRFEELKK